MCTSNEGVPTHASFLLGARALLSSSSAAALALILSAKEVSDECVLAEPQGTDDVNGKRVAILLQKTKRFVPGVCTRARVCEGD